MEKVGCELHLRVLRIVLADKASNKPNNDHLPAGGADASGTRLARRMVRRESLVGKTKANTLAFRCLRSSHKISPRVCLIANLQNCEAFSRR